MNLIQYNAECSTVIPMGVDENVEVTEELSSDSNHRV